MRAVVVGGGISGLTTTYLARASGHDAVCIEPARPPGGLIRSQCHDGFLCEVGPQAVLDDAPDTLALIAALGLDARVVHATPDARRRLIYAQGALHELPMSPSALLRSGLLSPLGKLRLLAEPFVRARRAMPDGPRGNLHRAPGAGHDDDDVDDETVAAFGARRLGREAARTLLDTAVIGIYATDAAALSVGSALPKLAALERDHGSLFRGVMTGRKRGKRPGHPVSFPDGLGELTAALGRALGDSFVHGRAAAIEPRPSGGWRIAVDGNGPAQRDADIVVVTTDAATAGRLVAPFVPEVGAVLAGVSTTPIAVCCLGFRDATAATLGMDLSAYGFLVARGQEPLLLGCQYESSTFAGRAPPGAVLLRAILGGSGPGFEPDVVDKTDDEIAARALSDLRLIAGLRRERQPDLVRVWRHPHGIPVYAPGHARRVATIDAALRRHPGLFVLGHALRGVGVNESIRAATAFVRDGLVPPA